MSLLARIRIKDDDVFYWSEDMHDYILENRLAGKEFEDANMTEELKNNPYYLNGVLRSTRKSNASTFTPNTKGNNEKRNAIKHGVLRLKYLLTDGAHLPQLAKMFKTGQIKKNQMVEFYALHGWQMRYFIDEIEKLWKFTDQEHYHVGVRGSTWGGSGVLVDHHYKKILAQFGIPIENRDRGETEYAIHKAIKREMEDRNFDNETFIGFDEIEDFTE